MNKQNRNQLQLEGSEKPSQQTVRVNRAEGQKKHSGPVSTEQQCDLGSHDLGTPATAGQESTGSPTEETAGLLLTQSQFWI